MNTNAKQAPHQSCCWPHLVYRLKLYFEKEALCFSTSLWKRGGGGEGLHNHLLMRRGHLRLLTTLQLHYARLHIHGEILQIHRTGERQSQSENRIKIADLMNHARILLKNSLVSNTVYEFLDVTHANVFLIQVQVHIVCVRWLMQFSFHPLNL